MTDEEIAKKIFEFAGQAYAYAFSGAMQQKWENLGVYQQQGWYTVAKNKQILIDCPDVDTFIPKYYDIWKIKYARINNPPTLNYYTKLFELIHTYNWDDTGTTTTASAGELTSDVYKLKSSDIKFTIMGYLKRDEVDVVVIKYKHDGSVAEILKNEFEEVAVKL